MPGRLAQACRVMGCPKLEPCPLHGRAAQIAMVDRRRGSAAHRGYDARWRAFVVQYFGELYALKVPRAGLCGCRHPSAPVTTDSVCASTGRPALATLLDHIVPIRGKADPRFYDVSNLQGLCDRCHNIKRQREGTRAKRRA
jgi:5-methylcytosine-specific restriction protein A